MSKIYLTAFVFGYKTDKNDTISTVMGTPNDRHGFTVSHVNAVQNGAPCYRSTNLYDPVLFHQLHVALEDEMEFDTLILETLHKSPARGTEKDAADYIDRILDKA